MAFAFDSATSSVSADETDVSSVTFSHHVAPGVNMFLMVGCCLIDLDAGTATVNTVTYNAVGLTEVPSSEVVATGGGFDFMVTQYSIAGPSTGPNNVVITASEVCNYCMGGASSFFGVHQTAPLGTAATNTGTDATPEVTVTSAAGEIVHAITSAVWGATEAGFISLETERWRTTDPTGAAAVGATQVGAASVTMDWQGGDGAFAWAACGVSIKPADIGIPVAWITA